jgi:predicted alpha-1,6-mannanase (GH76 family)
VASLRERFIRSARPQTLVILASAVTVAAMVAVPAAVSGDAASASPVSRASTSVASAASIASVSPEKAGLVELIRSYNAKDGEIGKSWWQAAVALSTLETYQQATGDSSYSFAIRRAFADHASHDFEDRFDDDTSWWGLAWLQAYQITRSRQYLSMAETDANYVHRQWDNTCGGGVWWQTSPHTYKNAIPNELFLELTAWLHNTIRGDKKYLGWAKAEWSWFRRSGMINGSNLVNDGLTSACENNQRTTWTYNQGVILAGLSQLYRATKNASLLTEAERIARAAISHLTVGGVLHEPCDGSGCGSNAGGDAQSFKGIFVRDLKVLAVTARTSQFNGFFRRQAQSIEAHDTSSSHQLGMFWAGPLADRTSYSQASAEAALVAALGLR